MDSAWAFRSCPTSWGRSLWRRLSFCPHVPPRAGEFLLPGLGRVKLHVAEEPVPVHTLVWRNCFQSFWRLNRIFHLEWTTNDHI